MPQMSPFNWLTMNLYFTNIMILLMIITYYSKNYSNTFTHPPMMKYLYKFKW